MNTRPYSDLYGLVEALCGCTFAAQEAVRVKYFINRRAQKAYAESEFWPRFYVVGEERIVSEDGLLPYKQPGLNDIGTVLQIHANEPFKSRSAPQYGDFYAASGGIQITGYDPANRTTGPDYEITGSANTYFQQGQYYKFPNDDPNGDPTRFISNVDLSTTVPLGLIGYNTSNGLWAIYMIADLATIAFWEAGEVVATPDLVTTWVPSGNNSGSFTVTEFPIYSAFITYKAALSATYGDADGDTSDVPEEWFEYMAHGAYSDFLRSDQQQDRAALAEQEANEILMAQLEKIGRQNGSSVSTRVVTNQNTQRR